MKMYRLVLVTLCILYLSTSTTAHRKRDRCWRKMVPKASLPNPTSTKDMAVSKCMRGCTKECVRNNCFAFRCNTHQRYWKAKQGRYNYGRQAKCELFLYHQSLSDFSIRANGIWRHSNRRFIVNTCFKPCDNNPCASQENTECYVNADTSTYECRCSEGYEKKEDGTCQLVDPCDSAPCASKANSECVSSGSTFECKCVEGYEKDANDECQQVDPCDSAPCASKANSECVSNGSTFECKCVEGYEKDVNNECQQVNVEPVCSLTIDAGYGSGTSLTIARLNECKDSYESQLKEQYEGTLQTFLPNAIPACVEEKFDIKLTFQETTPVGVTATIEQVYKDGQECVNTINTIGADLVGQNIEITYFGSGNSQMDLVNVVDGSGEVCPNLEFTDGSLSSSAACV